MYQYDGDALIAEVSQVTPNPILRRYVHGPGVDEPLVWYEGAGVATPRTLRANWQGSVVAVVNTSGAAIGRNAYDEWGIPAAANLGRFQYTGQIWLPDAGMYYYKARMYSPTLGRFMQTDPIGYEDQVNLYAYVGGDPVNLVDQTGEVIETIWDVANIGLGVASAAGNIAAGNYGKAAVDIVGVVVDAAAAVVPGVPGGAGTAIKAARGAVNGVRAGKPHTRAAIRVAKERNAGTNGGKVLCADAKCGRETIPTTRRTKGSKVDLREGQGDHKHPRAKGGDGATVKDQRNIDIKYFKCNLEKRDKILS